MSYILDALRKSEQQRRQGAAPLARLAEAGETGPLRRTRSLNGMIAVLLIGSGVAVGWWRPWQAGPAMPVPAATVALPPAPPPEARRATPAPPAEPVSPRPAAVAQAAPPPPAAGTDAAGGPDAGSLSELAPELRQELPALVMSLHSHSADPKERMVMLNGTMLHEGDQVTPGLLLQEVTPDGAILAYRGQRFLLGLRQ